MQRTYTQTTHYYVDGNDNEFEVPYEFSEYHAEHLKITGNTAVLGVLVHDEMPSNPIEEFDQGELILFSQRHRRPDAEDFKSMIRENPGRMVFVHERGRQSGYFADHIALDVHHTKGEECYSNEIENVDGCYVVPDDVTKPLEYAEAVIKEFSSYCEGDTWGICIWQYRYDQDEEVWEFQDGEEDECWGFYGEEYAEGELKRQFEYYVKEKGEEDQTANC